MRFPLSRHSFLTFIHDLSMAGLSILLSLALRVGSDIFNYSSGFLASTMATFIAVSAVIFLALRLSSGVWRYVSMVDLLTITRAATLVILLFVPITFLISRGEDLPRSVPVINWFVLIALLGGPRFIYRILRDHRLDMILTSPSQPPIPVLLVGDGDAAEMFIRAMRRDSTRLYRIAGLISVSGNRIGRKIQGVPVLGRIADIPTAVGRLQKRDEQPRRLILADDTLSGPDVAALLDTATSLGMTLARLPRLTDFRAGQANEIEFRPIDIEDLLGRPQAVLDRDNMRRLIDGRRILVTGAGGSIGSELVRQICSFKPDRIALLDSSEFALYVIDLETGERFPELPRTAYVADVRDQVRLAQIMAAERPELVFHAAALKHVPMVESNPFEGIRTNALGTRNVADACVEHEVGLMVLISTDKAVNPTNIMGASKRIAECYCQALDLQCRGVSRFVTVRFGNVLGSTGSVVPLFQRQLAKGGPLTVTHPDIERYFMTIREAVELVLQASVLGYRSGEAGTILVLDMGKPVKIVDLARQMIRLAGLKPEVDIKIEFSGLRPGEKLFEEMFHERESLLPTAHQSILMASPRTVDPVELRRVFDEMSVACQEGDRRKLDALICRLVPEYDRPTANAKEENSQLTGPAVSSDRKTKAAAIP